MWSYLDKPDVAERLQAIRAAYEMGLRIRAADLRDLLGIAQPGPQEETLQHPALAPQTPPQAPPDLMPPENPSPEQSYYQSDPWQHYQAKKKHFEGEIRQEPNTRHLQILHKGRWHNLPEEHPGGPEGQSPPAGRPEGQKSHSLFVSPNVAEGLTIEQALKALKSPQHQIAKKQYEDIVNRYRALMSQNFRCQLHDSVGDWSDGAENSLHLEIWNADPILLKVMAAEMGLVSDPPQKAVAFFYPQPNGADIRWRSILSENLEKIRMELDRVDLQYRTLIPHENAWEIIICGGEKELLHKIKKLPDFFVKSAYYHVGHFEYFGDENRQKSGELYRQIIEEFWRPRREKMSEPQSPQPEQEPEPQYQHEFMRTKNFWFLEEKPTWDSKTRAIARIMREQYEYEMLSPEEKAAYKEECRKLEEELRARGMRREDEKDDPQGSVFT